MAITLQGNPYNLQGSVPSIQGGPAAATLQPAGSPVAAPVAAPVVPAAAPKTAPAQPSLIDLSGRYGLSNGTVYRKGDNFAFSDPQSFFKDAGVNSFNNLKFDTAFQPVAQPTQTMALGNGQSYDVNGQPVQSPGALPVPTTPPATPPSADPNQTRIGELSKQLFSTTTPNQQKLYEDAYNTAGLGTIKTKLEGLNAKIADLTAKYTEKEGTINENPFLSEASRVGRLKRLNDQRNAEVGNLINEYKSYADLYNQGVTEINDAVSRQVGDFNTKRQISTGELSYLLGIQQKADTFAKDNNIRARFFKYPGSNTVYDATTREPLTYEQYVARGGTGKPGMDQFPDVQTLSSEGNLKDYPASYQEYLLAKKDGFTGTYNDYQNLDANRKISIARAGASVIGSSGLNSKEATIFNGIVDKYNKSPLIMAADKMNGYLTTIESAGQGQSTPQKDLNLIYAYIKALDYGESAVREGEINLGMDTGSIKQQLNAKIAKLSGGGLLDASQRQNYISAARELISSVNAAAKAKEASFASQAQVTGVGDAWNQFRGAVQASYDQPQGGQSGVDINDLF